MDIHWEACLSVSYTHLYNVRNGLIDPNPKFSIQLSNSTDIIMFEQGLGSYAEKWEKLFSDNNIIIH